MVWGGHHVRNIDPQFTPQTYTNVRMYETTGTTLHWRHNGSDGVSNHQPDHCLLSRLFRRRWKKTSKLQVTGLCAGNSPVTDEFPAWRASNAENFSICWRHHENWSQIFCFTKRCRSWFSGFVDLESWKTLHAWLYQQQLLHLYCMQCVHGLIMMHT